MGDGLGRRLAGYLERVLAADGPVQVDLEGKSDEAGFSSETTIYRASWTAKGHNHSARHVLKQEPGGVTVFRTNDLDMQVACLRTVAAHSAVPVPAVIAHEPAADVLGAPFYIMEAVEGLVPPDNPPFPSGGWIYEASVEDQHRLHTGGVDALAGLHSIDPGVFGFLDRPKFGTTGVDQQLGEWEDMLAWGRSDEPLPIIDQAMTWLRGNLPTSSSSQEIVLNWGDARISNIIWRDFVPAAVIDWEMAALGPPAVDVAWYIHIDRALTDAMGASPLPGFLDPPEIVAHYEQRTGRAIEDFEWFEVFAAVRFAIVMMRIGRRMVETYDLDRSLEHNNLGVRALARVLRVADPGEPAALG